MSSLFFSLSLSFSFFFFITVVMKDCCSSVPPSFLDSYCGLLLPISEHRWNPQLIQTQNFRVCGFSIMQLCPWEALSGGEEQPSVVRTVNSPLNHSFQSLDVDPPSTETKCYWCKCWYRLTAICEKFWFCIIWVDSENDWKQKSIYRLQV